jgi:hypothetical protein
MGNLSKLCDPQGITLDFVDKAMLIGAAARPVADEHFVLVAH